MTTIPAAVRKAYGSLPSGWRIERLKFFVDVRNSNVDKIIDEDETAVLLCNYTDIYYNDKITPDMNFMPGSATKAEIDKFQLKRGQVILTKDSESWNDIGIPAYVTQDMPHVVCGYHLSVLEPRNTVDGAFLAWLCRADPLNDQFKIAANGVTRFGLGQYPMRNAFIAVPPLETQHRIVQILDEKTAQIDTLIAKKRALLDRLAEQRQALITHAVTKGLNPKAPMIPSGIEWLGDIPAHWEVLPLKRRIDKIAQGWSPAADERIAADDEWGVLKSGCVNEGVYNEKSHKAVPSFLDPKPEIEVKSGDVLMCRASGSLKYIGSVALVDKTRPKLMFSDKIYRIDLHKSVDRRFFVYSMAAIHLREQIILSVSGAEGLANNIAQSSVGKYIHVFPPTDEQAEIADHLDRSVAHIESIKVAISKSIQQLHDYRSTLITSAVTGQIAGLQ